jgi:hypothetical protein
MNWGNLAGNVGGGAAAGSAFGPWGTAAGAGLGLMQSFMGDPSETAENEENKGWDQAQKYQHPYWQGGVDQYGRLNQATGDLMDPQALQDKWSKGYQQSDYAKQLLGQNKTSGLDAASSMGLMGSSAALGNIQQGAGNIVAKDRQQYMDDMMKKYMAGIGLGKDMYGIGATAGANLGGQAMTHGENRANLGYNRINQNQSNLAQGAAYGMNAYQDNPNQFNSNWKGFLK